MAPPAQPADRHEPLPGLLGLPAHLLRKLSPRGRRLVLAAGALMVAAGVVAAIVLGPRIAESNRERAAEQQRAERRGRAAERARLAAEQRPRTGKLAPGGAAAAIAGVEEAITRDATARRATGELATRVRRTDCRTLGRDAGRLVLSCTAITSEVKPSDVTRGLVVGYPFRAAVSPETGRYGLCKTSGRPGEGAYIRGRPQVELPRVCGGLPARALAQRLRAPRFRSVACERQRRRGWAPKRVLYLTFGAHPGANPPAPIAAVRRR
jgi:hypothetical protein